MDYIEVNITNLKGFDPEIAMAQMAELGFESFSESECAIQGFIREDYYHEKTITEYLQQKQEEHDIRYTIQKIPDQNWNAIWESAYEPVTIAGKCQVRAPFHKPLTGIQFDIVIEPKMSFGTAHHETTSLMMELLMMEDVKGKRVLDMGCGTGILAILALKMQAGQVVAVDNDDWAFANASENMKKNDAVAVKVIPGGISTVPLPQYDLILANINRNVLLTDIPAYAGFLKHRGILMLSGFYEADLDLIKDASAKAGLQYISHKADNEWVGAKFMK